MKSVICIDTRYYLRYLLAIIVFGFLPLLVFGVAFAAGDDTRPRGQIISAAEIDYPPFSVVDAAGRANGFSVELMRAALAAMDRDVSFDTGQWAEVKHRLEQGTIQALPLVGRTPEREKHFDFTFPYMSLHGAIVVRKEVTDIRHMGDLRGRQVAVMKGDNAEEFLRREDHGIKIHTTVTFEDALRELSAGRHDAVITQRLVALRLIQETGLANLQIIGRPIDGFRQDFCFAVKKGDHKTLALLNEGLAIVMADGTFRHLHAKWFAALELPSHRRIVIGGDHNFPPFEFLDQDGRPAGYNVDLTRAIARELGLEIDIRLGPWAQVGQQLARNDIDVIQGMLYSPWRGLSFDLTPPHRVLHYVGVIRKGEGAPPKVPSDLKGKRLVVQQGDIMHDFVVEHDFENQTVIVDTQEDALRELSMGRHDYALVSRLTAMHWIEQHGLDNLVVGRNPLLSPGYCYAVAKGQGALLSQFTEGLRILEETGEYHRITEKWMGVYEPSSPNLVSILRYIAIIVTPLLLILIVFFLWSWSLRQQVFRQTSALRTAEEFQRAMITCSPVALYSIDLDGRTLTWNASAEGMFGWTAEEVIGRPLLIVPRDMEAEFRELLRRVSAGQQFAGIEVERMKKDGTRFEGSLSVAPIRNDEGKIFAIMGAMEDISHRKQVEKTIKDSEQHFRNLADSGSGLIFTSGTDQGAEYFNRPWLTFTGRTMAQELDDGWLEGIHPDDLTGFIKTFNRAFEHRERFSRIFRLRRHDKTYRWIQNDGTARYDSSGHFIGYINHCLDITESRHAQERIEHLNKVLRAIRDVNQLIARERNRDTIIREACRIMVENRGYVCAFIVLTDDAGQPTTWAQAGMDVEFNEMEELLMRGQRPFCHDSIGTAESVFSIDGIAAFCKKCPLTPVCSGSSLLCVRLVNEGVVMGYLSVMLEQGAAVDPEEQTLFADMAADIAFVLRMLQMDQARLKIEREHKALQEQMVQAQKMESVGRLAGGVAHDYNNMLSVILGYTEMVMDRTAPDSPIYEDLQEIYKAGSRSKEITRQLLAFARKQTIAPELLDLNEKMESMLKMLHRLIGEDIDLAWHAGSQLWQVKIDPVQVDQILANLCVNARDAIDGVGKVTIETRNITFDEAYCEDHAGFFPGEFVLLAVSDDGCGMQKETLDNIFEPFFTTKHLKEGTGLGLSTVYGIVKQNEGFINVYSEPDKGTTFKIYLPRHASDAPVVKPVPEVENPLSRGETILLVEDEPAIMKMGKTMLEKLGYEVLTADTPNKALELARQHNNEIDLLITDVVMPQMNGRDLANQLNLLYPAIKTLFMSGYTANVIAHRGVLDDGVNFMQKPFSLSDLANKIRSTIDNTSDGDVA